MPIITDTGFAPDDAPDLIEADDLPETGERLAILLPNDADPSALAPAFNRITLIVVPFPNAADGRGFSIAKRLRGLGYRGHLRAQGHLITDQYPFARQCGFDDVQIDAALAARMPEELWLRAKDRAIPPFLRRA